MTRIFFLSYFNAFCVLLVTSIIGCTPSAENDNTQNAYGLVEFPHQVHAQYATGFKISYRKNYKLLEIIKPFQDQVDTLRYSLVPRDIADRVEVEDTEEIAVPIHSLIATSTTHIALTDMLNSNDVVTGVMGPDYVYNEEIRKRLNSNKIVSFPMGELNKEKVLAMQPDLLIISGGQSSQFDNYRVLMDSGINLLVNSEWLETTPLGKAEWIKVMAALLNEEKLANKKFNRVARQYNKLKAAVDTTREKPLVLNNLPYKGAWFVSGGESFTARFLKDAGADYPWYDDHSTGGLRRSFEAVYEIGLKADIWLNPGSTESRKEILAKDDRFRDFKSFQTGEIYNNNKRMSQTGGNDFWESGVVHPEILLADLVKIFHPEVVPEHQLYYYQKLD